MLEVFLQAQCIVVNQKTTCLCVLWQKQTTLMYRTSHNLSPKRNLKTPWRAGTGLADERHQKVQRQDRRYWEQVNRTNSPRHNWPRAYYLYLLNPLTDPLHASCGQAAHDANA